MTYILYKTNDKALIWIHNNSIFNKKFISGLKVSIHRTLGPVEGASNMFKGRVSLFLYFSVSSCLIKLI